MKRMYVLEKGKEFTGSVVNTITVNDDGQWFADYSGGQTWDEYKKEHLEKNPGEKLIAVNADEMETILNKYIDSLIEPFTEISEDTWIDMLEIMPPMRWHRYRGLEIFFICEALYGDIHKCYVSDGTTFASAHRKKREPSQSIADAFMELNN